MGTSTVRRTVTRVGATGGLAAALVLVGGGAAGAAGADPVPNPLDQATQRLADPGDLGGPAPTSGTSPLGELAGQVTDLLGAQGSPTPAGSMASAGDNDKSDSDGGADTAGPSAGGSQATGGPATSKDAPGTGTKPAGTPAGKPKAGTRVTSEALTACVIPTGSGSPAVEFDLSVLGNDAGSPLAEAIPQAFTPCPEGAVPADDSLVGADLDVEGLLGACVRVTREVAPLRTTLVVLDHDVIKALSDAGLPLEQLVVPCPGRAAAPAPATADTPPAGSSPAPGDRPASAVPELPHRLAFTGADTVPLASLALVLVAAGAVLTRQARRLRPCASRG